MVVVVGRETQDVCCYSGGSGCKTPFLFSVIMELLQICIFCLLRGVQRLSESRGGRVSCQ